MIERLAWSVVLSAAMAALAGAQDVLHYELDSGAGATEVNFGDPASGIPRTATIVADPAAPLAQAWASGKSGTALAAGPASSAAGYELDTGWDDVVGTGVSVTIAFFYRMIHPVSPATSAYLCGPPGTVFDPGIRMWTGTTPGSFGYMRVAWWGMGSGSSSTLAQDLLSPASLNWVHLAVVIDRSGNPCNPPIQWYVNGVAQPPQAGAGCWGNIPGTSLSSFRFGRNTTANFKLDGCRLCLRVVPAAEVLQWATQDLAADAPFGDPCHPFGLPVLLWGSPGSPSVGNGAYKLTVYGLTSSTVTLGLGLSDTSFAGSPLPIDLGAFIPTLSGCLLRVSPDYLFGGTIPATGSLDFPLPIPALASLIGVNAYAQAVLYSPALGSWSLTNAWAMHLGS